MILYHGTRSTNINGILLSGLNAGFGWGAEKPGVFLSKDPETAMYWARMSIEKSGDTAASPVVLEIEIPTAAVNNIIPRKTSFSKPGDVEYLGPIPKTWIRLLPPMQEGLSLLKDLIREHLK